MNPSPHSLTPVGILCLAAATVARADLIYTFNSDVEGFQNVSWESANPVGWPDLPGSIKQVHTAGGWQMLLTKEFSWAPGGGNETNNSPCRPWPMILMRSEVRCYG